MNPVAANLSDASYSENTSVGMPPLTLKAITILACLIFIILWIYLSGGNQIFVCIVSVLMLSNVLFSKRENMTKINASLLTVTLVVIFLATLLSAINLTRPLTHAHDFFGVAGIDFQKKKSTYSQTGDAMFRVAITTEEFEKLVTYYRVETNKKWAQDCQYDWGYFELDPSCLNRDRLLDAGDKLSDSHLEKMETTDMKVVEPNEVTNGIKTLMEGFPELGEDLGRCRAIISHSPEVVTEFYWFEKQQKGYINP